MSNITVYELQFYFLLSLKFTIKKNKKNRKDVMKGY